MTTTPRALAPGRHERTKRVSPPVTSSLSSLAGRSWAYAMAFSLFDESRIGDWDRSWSIHPVGQETVADGWGRPDSRKTYTDPATFGSLPALPMTTPAYGGGPAHVAH